MTFNKIQGHNFNMQLSEVNYLSLKVKHLEKLECSIDKIPGRATGHIFP